MIFTEKRCGKVAAAMARRCGALCRVDEGGGVLTRRTRRPLKGTKLGKRALTVAVEAAAIIFLGAFSHLIRHL